MFLEFRVVYWEGKKASHACYEHSPHLHKVRVISGQKDQGKQMCNQVIFEVAVESMSWFTVFPCKWASLRKPSWLKVFFKDKDLAKCFTNIETSKTCIFKQGNFLIVSSMCKVWGSKFFPAEYIQWSVLYTAVPSIQRKIYETKTMYTYQPFWDHSKMLCSD